MASLGHIAQENFASFRRRAHGQPDQGVSRAYAVGRKPIASSCSALLWKVVPLRERLLELRRVLDFSQQTTAVWNGFGIGE